jgi:uncharacterized membrane protein YqhA
LAAGSRCTWACRSRCRAPAIKFFQQAAHCLTGILTLAETGLVLSVLSLIDLVLVGSLIVMVILSGYENFVSKLDTGSGKILLYVVLHLTFVVSAVLLGVLDRTAFASHRGS